jgi:endoglucanase
VKDSAKWKGTKWTGSAAEQAAIRKSLESAADWGKKHDRPILLGEFGAYRDADMDSRVRWTRFISGEATKLGMSWTYWEFCSGFGAYDPKAKAWRKPLASSLLR